MPPKKGIYETIKFNYRKENYYNSFSEMLNLGYSTEDYLHHFPSFVGHMTIGRVLTLTDLYKMTIGVAGHIADVGVYKGASAILFAKLIKLFEPEALTMVHGFDWFKGTNPGNEDKLQVKGDYHEDEKRLKKLVTLQNLDHILKIHKLDIAKDLKGFFKSSTNNYMQFKLVFLDSGTYDVVSSAIKEFWPRLTPGGLLVIDQYNHEVAPGEVRAVKELLPDLKVETLPNSWMPNAFIRKPFKT